ncbi:MAG TPA: hypothetical protein VJQ43_06320 [Thermoplasmata archaeon]|nr:hypothetical protein [Thermoplasmata archaeon]
MRAYDPTRRSGRTVLVVLLVGLVVFGGMTLVRVTAGTVPAPLAASHPVAAGIAGHSPAAARVAANATIASYQSVSNFAMLPSADWYCRPYFASSTSACDAQAQNPTVVTLPNGDVGVGFSVITGLNSTNFVTCPSASDTVTRVGFAVSTSNGTSFGSPVFLPTPSAPCDFVQQLEPTFAVSGATLWAAYIGTNATNHSLIDPPLVQNPPIDQWTNRSSDGIVIVNSTTNGSSFGTASFVKTGANYANPRLAIFGKSLYLLYENLSNGSSPLPTSGSPAQLPISEQLLYSPDNGVTWKGPYVLPGENVSMFYNTMGGSVSVSQTGTVAVAYATNRSCVNSCFAGTYAATADDVVVATSVTNGTSWIVHTVAKAQAEIINSYSPVYCTFRYGPAGTGMCALSQNAPKTSLAWGTGGNLYIAWEASRHRNVTSVPTYFYDYDRVEVYAGASTTGGATWSTSRASPALSDNTNQQNLYDENWFNPALGASGGTVYLTFSYQNWSAQTGYQDFGRGYTDGTYSQWVTTSSNGISYAAPSLVAITTATGGYGGVAYVGDRASVGFTSGGTQVLAYALPTGNYVGLIPSSYEDVVTLSVATPSTGPTTTLTIVETGLANGTPWSFAVNGEVFNATQSSVNVSGVPIGATTVVSWPGPAKTIGYRTIEAPQISAPTFDTLSGPSTVWFNFTSFYGISFSPQPNDFYLSVQLANYGTVMAFQDQFTWDTYIFGPTTYYFQQGTEMPWYFAAGTHLYLRPTFSYPIDASYYTQQFVGYWNGTGAGSYTGPGSAANLTVNSPFNESLWDLSVGSYSERFTPVGLPASSTYSFRVDGAAHSASGATPVVVANLMTGAHSVTNITATSARSGWEYFGRSAGGNPLLVPIVPQDNLTFAFVNTSATPGAVSFHAVGVTPGSSWSLSFNGSTYSSTTPWINVTSRPGTYPVTANDVVSANGSAALTPLGFGPLLNVTTSQTYDVNFTGTYKLTVLASSGGTVSPSGGSFWLTPNAIQNLTASVASGFTWGGWTGTGPGSYSGMNLTAKVQPTGPVQEAASFVPLVPNRFNLTVNETGLAAGTSWTVFLNGKGYTSTNASFTVPNLYSCALSGSLGTYSVFAPLVGGSSGTQFVPSPSNPATACVTRPLILNYTTQYAVTLSTTAGGTVVGANTTAVTWVAAGGLLGLQETPNPGYQFLGWTGTGPGSVTSNAASISVTPVGPVSELAAWAPTVHPPPPTYSVTFTAGATLPDGASWSVVFNGSVHTGTARSIVVSGLSNSTYPYSVPTVTAGSARYQPNPPGTSVLVKGADAPVAIPFAASFWVSISGVGPGTVTASAWVASGHTIVLNASPAGNALFEGWSGTGSGAYTGPAQGPTVRVTAPISEVATFVGVAGTAPPPPPPASPSTLVIVGLALVGLAVGVAVGVVLARRNRPPSGPEEAP